VGESVQYWLDYAHHVCLPSDVFRPRHAPHASRHGYRLSVFCWPCGRHVFLDLPALIAAGEGAREVVGLRVRCRVCGGGGELSIIWDSLHRGRP
jgi:hypothetical protein